MKRIAFALCLALAPMAMGQTAQPILRHTFDTELHGWSGIGINCRAAVATGSSFNGIGALKFDYDIKQGAFGMLTYAPPEGSLASASAFRFWIRVDQPTTVAFIAQEKGGGRFMAFLVPPRGKWQQVDIALGDLILNEGPNDPRDADGKLDPGRIENIAVGDVAQLVAQAGSQDIERILGVQQGPRTLLLDDFTVITEKLPPSVLARAGEVRLDSFARPQIAWMATGNAALSVVDAGGQGAKALQASYTRTSGRVLALVRMFPKGTLKGMDRLAFTASSQQPTMLLVQVEEAGGGKFNTVCSIADPGAEKTFTLEFAGLNASDDSPVKDRPVKPELISQVVFIDASALAGTGPEGQNVLVLRGLAGSAAPRQ
ncbi:MAG: hypothetical protein GX446_07325 [Chthonomonadales bacterium]|nr:hypothetical protein [Chthonomonadales bacterium]